MYTQVFAFFFSTSDIMEAVRSRFRSMVKFIYSKKVTKFCEIFTADLTGTTWDKYMMEILQNFVAFSEYMNFMKICYLTYIQKWDSMAVSV